MGALVSVRKEVFLLLGEFVKDYIPFGGTLLALGEVQASLSDKIFRAKIDSFIKALPEIEKDQKEKFIHEFSEDPNKKQKLGEILLLSIDQISDFDKVEFLSKAFSAYIRQEITIEVFKKLAAAINFAFSDDLKKFGHGNEGNLSLMQAMVHTGLTVVVKDRRTSISYPGGEVKRSGIEIVTSDLGRTFRKIAQQA
jgi:hypothetical protein